MGVDVDKSVTAEVYIKTLNFYLLHFLQEIWEKGIDPILIQEKDWVYIAGITKDWLLETNVRIQEHWPTYSPDLNRIEYV